MHQHPRPRMPPIHRVSTTDTLASESTLQTVQDSEVSNDDSSTCDTCTDVSCSSSAYCFSTDTPSWAQTAFGITRDSYCQTRMDRRKGVVPDDDWGYDLYHPESRLSDCSSLKPTSVKSAKGFGFSRKSSARDSTPSRSQLETGRLEPTDYPKQTARAPLTLNQIDLLTASQINSPPFASRQQVPNQSRLAALTRFGNSKEQVTGAVKLVFRSTGDEGVDTELLDADVESVFTTITTTSTSSGGSDIVPVYGRGGAGRAAGARVITQIYGRHSMSAANVEMHSAVLSNGESPSQAVIARSRGLSSVSGLSGGKAYLGKLRKEASQGSSVPPPDAARISPNFGSMHITSPDDSPDRGLEVGPSTSRESLATMKSCPLQASEESRAYGRGGFARKTPPKGPESKLEENGRQESRTGALLSRIRKKDKSVPDRGAEDEEEPVPAYGRGGAARKNKH